MEAALDGVEAAPDLFPASSRDLPDINFFYRYGSQKKRRPDRAGGTEIHRSDSEAFQVEEGDGFV